MESKQLTMIERIELARKLDRQRLDMQKAVDALASQVAEHKTILKGAMDDLGAYQLSAPSGPWVKLDEKEVLSVKNWTKFYAFVVGCYEQEADHEQDVAMMMLQKRPSDSVVKTFMEMHGLTAEQIGVVIEEIKIVKIGG